MTRTWLIFISVSVVCAAVVASARGLFFLPGITPFVSGCSLVLGAVVSGFFTRKPWVKWRRRIWNRASWIDRGFMMIIFLGSALTFLFIFSESKGMWGGTSPNNLGDLPFHLQLVEFFARGAHFPPMDPTFAHESLHYPYAIDVWDAMWTTIGIPFVAMLVITGVISVFATVSSLWLTGGLILLCAFFLSGGIASQFGWEYGYGPSSPLVWKNLFQTLFVTQRGFLWALPAGIEIMREWQRYLDEDRRPANSFFWLWAILPYFHLHTFVVLSIWMGMTIVLQKRDFPKRFIPASLVALIFILRSVTKGNIDSSVAWQWGWMFTDFHGLLANLGSWLLVPLFVAVIWIKEKRWSSLFIALTLTFFAVNLKLAPWAWDQIKILVWVYLLWTFWLVRDYKWKGASAAILSLFLFWPGGLQWVSGWPSFAGRFEIQDGADRASVQKLISELGPDEIIAAKVDHRNPLLGLGRSLVLGFPGHAWSHGLPLAPRQAGLDQIFLGQEAGQTFARDIKAGWLVWKDDSKLIGAPPIDVWSRWGWTEKKRVGLWHLWQIRDSVVSSHSQ